MCSRRDLKKRSEGGKTRVPLSFGTFAGCRCEVLKAGASSWSPGGGQGGGFVPAAPNPAFLCAPKAAWEGGGRTASPRGAQPSSWQHGAAGHRSPSLPTSLFTSPPSSRSEKRICFYDIYFKRNGFSLSGGGGLTPSAFRLGAQETSPFLLLVLLGGDTAPVCC